MKPIRTLRGAQTTCHGKHEAAGGKREYVKFCHFSANGKSTSTSPAAPPPGASHLLVSTSSCSCRSHRTQPHPRKCYPSVGSPEAPHSAVTGCRARKRRSDPPSSPGTALTHPHHPQETLSTHTAWEQVSLLCGLSRE